MSDDNEYPSTSASDGHDTTFRAKYDWRDIAPSTAIVETVAIATGRKPVALESLYDWIDTDAIDALFGGTSDDRSRSPLSVSFAYDDYTITVERNGTVSVEPSAG